MSAHPRVRAFGVSVLGIVATLLLAGSALAQITPVLVIGGKAQQSLGFANQTWVAWTSRANSTQHQTLSKAFARRLAGGSSIRLNPKNTQGFTGGFDPGTNTIIYQQIDLSARTNPSDLYFYDLDTQTRAPVTEVNTKRWEWGPRISSGYILYNLDYRTNRVWHTAIELYDRSAGTTTRLASWPTGKFNPPTGRVGETYATWTLCSSSCSAYVFDIATMTTSEIPTRDLRPQYAPVVDETNARVYYVRSAKMSCGHKVVMLRLPVADLSQTPTKIVAMPEGIDIDSTMSLATDPSTGGTDLLFSRIICRNSNEDVYEMVNVGSVPDGSITSS
jgi:hypothetical protein